MVYHARKYTTKLVLLLLTINTTTVRIIKSGIQFYEGVVNQNFSVVTLTTYVLSGAILLFASFMHVGIDLIVFIR